MSEESSGRRERTPTSSSSKSPRMHHQRTSRSFSLAPTSRRKSLALFHPFDGDDGRSVGIRLRQQLQQSRFVRELTEDHHSESGGGGEGAEDDDSELPFPGFVKKAFFLFEQTTPPRSWCLAAMTWPYPFLFMFTSLQFK